MKVKFESVTVILNRHCPRTCLQCGIADQSRPPMSVDKWKEALSIMQEVWEVPFFLFLGTEPLLFREDLTELVRYMNDCHMFYGFYSTSPEPLFSRYKEQLVDAGLQNWSAGIDDIPETLKTADPITRKKVEESIIGLQWMAERGVQTHTLTTIHKKNVKDIPSVLRWCQDNIPNVQSSLNFIEWDREGHYDFFSPPEQMGDLLWDGSDEEREEVKRMLVEVFNLSREKGRIIQAPDSWLLSAHRHYDKLDVHCKGIVGPAIDCDGTLRLCGYNTGNLREKFSVWDLKKDNSFYAEWEKALNRCQGCHWIYTDILQDPRMLDPTSGIHQERWCLEKV